MNSMEFIENAIEKKLKRSCYRSSKVALIQDLVHQKGQYNLRIGS